MITNIKDLMDQLSVEYGVSEDFLLDLLVKAIEQAWINDAGEGYTLGLEMQYSKYGNNLRCYRVVEVVEEVTAGQSQINLQDAQLIDPKTALGMNIKIDIDLSNISRYGAKIAEKYINQHMFQKKKQNEFEYFSDKVGTIVTGIVKAKSSQGIIVDFYGFEAIVTDYKPYQLNPGECPNGSTIKAYVYKVEENLDGFQVFLSRNNPEFVIELFKETIREIKDGLIRIMSVARNPGFASIILVKSEDEFGKLNAVSVCIGSGGQRIKEIQKALGGEKLFVIPWKETLFVRVATVLNHVVKKVQIKKIILHEEEKDRCLEVVVPRDQINKIVGVRGRTIKLLSQALGEQLKITAEDSDLVPNMSSYMTSQERESIVEIFKDLLNVNEEDAMSLVNSGVFSIESIVSMPFNEFLLVSLPNNNHGAIYNRALKNSKTKPGTLQEEGENDDKDGDSTDGDEDSEEEDIDEDDEDDEY